jgi:mycofactocin system glycosyltransferase
MPNNNLALSYRLRPAARYHRLPGGKSVLVLGFPLRTAFIYDTWKPLLSRLADGRWVPFVGIRTAVPSLSAEEIQRFLNTLIRKGYVEQRGFPLLKESSYPSVSVIIPVRNRPTQIQACLASLMDLDYPPEKLEIIVVDDASTDETACVVEKYSEVQLLRMRQHRQASYCRNQAADVAKGDILAFIDSDCLADPTWLKELVPAFGDTSLGALGGWVDAAWEEKALDRYEKVKSSLKIGSWFKRSGDREKFFYVPTCNFLVRRSVFIDLGGFRNFLHVGEDVDFCWRLQDAGHAMEYRPYGRVAHKHRNHLAAFCSRRFDYGTSEPVLQGLHTSRVKTLYLPWTESLFWFTVLLAPLFFSPWPIVFGAGIFFFDTLKKYARLRKKQIPVTPFQVIAAVFRSYLSFVYHCCSFISRYYIIGLPLVLLISPLISGTVLLMHLIAGIVENKVKKPRLNLLSFLFFFTLEQVSYQAGVWWQCIRQLNFKPVLPRIVHKQI